MTLIKAVIFDYGLTLSSAHYFNLPHPRIPQWHEWSIPLADFNGVDLTSVANLHIGFGVPGSTEPAGGHGIVLFDDIQLGSYVEECRSDFANDFWNAFRELVGLANMFRNISPYRDNAPEYNGPIPPGKECLDVSGPDGVPDGQLSFYDISTLASQMASEMQ